MASCDNGGCSTVSPTSDDVFTPCDKQSVLSLKIKPMKGNMVEVHVLSTDSVEALKAKIESSINIAPVEQLLSKRGKRIEAGTMSSNGIKDKDIILLMHVPQKGSSSSSSSSSSAASAASASPLSNSESPAPVRTLCLAHCGFYGDPQKDSLCSRCFDERQKRLQEEQEELRAKERQAREEAEAKLAAEREASRPKQLKPTRCFKCNVRVGPAIIQCRCGYGFCSKCRYPEQHDCEFDYKAHDTMHLQNRLTQVKGDKMRERT